MLIRNHSSTLQYYQVETVKGETVKGSRRTEWQPEAMTKLRLLND